MVIPGVKGPPSATGPARRRPARAAFSVPGEDAADTAGTAAAGPSGLGGLLALQEAAGPDAAGQARAADAVGSAVADRAGGAAADWAADWAANRAALEQGQAVMAELGRLQADVLTGGVLTGGAGNAAARLSSCVDAMASGPGAADPRLAAMLGALRVRAAIEVARAGLRPESDIEKSSPPNA